MVTRRFFVAAAMVAIAGCSLDKQTAPPLAGPSEMGLSLSISASPDIIAWDDSSVSRIEVTVRDANNQPVSGLRMNARVAVASAAEHGRLSVTMVTTNSDGKASLSYTPPNPSRFDFNPDAVATIEFTPAGPVTLPNGTVIPGNFAATVERTVEVQLRRLGDIVNPGAAPRAAFFFSPTAPRVADDVFFDGSASTGTNLSYQWSFGDGDSEVTSTPTTRHDYGQAGTYGVTLTVVDSIGRTNTTAPTQITVSALATPRAEFVMSPTNPQPGQVVNFNALASAAETGHSIVSYTWDFGDNAQLFTTTSPTTQRIYAAGVYTVTLQVTDSLGRKGTVSKTLTVAAPAEPE